MKAKTYPLIVSTWEALENSLRCYVPVIYIDGSLYEKKSENIRDVMSIHGYVLDSKRGKRGVFFLKTSGDKYFDPDGQEIYDPLDIL